jgi:hypothetical protein
VIRKLWRDICGTWMFLDVLSREVLAGFCFAYNLFDGRNSLIQSLAPRRSAHQSVRAGQQYIATGYRWVVDLDLEKF